MWEYAFDIHRKFSLDISQADELQFLKKHWGFLGLEEAKFRRKIKMVGQL